VGKPHWNRSHTNTTIQLHSPVTSDSDCYYQDRAADEHPLAAARGSSWQCTGAVRSLDLSLDNMKRAVDG
jgi:hypothetical protein